MLKCIKTPRNNHHIGVTFDLNFIYKENWSWKLFCHRVPMKRNNIVKDFATGDTSLLQCSITAHENTI